MTFLGALIVHPEPSLVELVFVITVISFGLYLFIQIPSAIVNFFEKIDRIDRNTRKGKK